MLAPKSWLNDLVDLKNVSDGDLVQALTFAGNKVENFHSKAGETVFEFEITSNRPDTLSIIGLARETAAVLGKNLKLPEIKEINWPGVAAPKFTVKEKKLCPAYALVTFSEVKVKPSSPLIQERLSLSGFRPVNNLVDITNYLMLLTGQPMHAFDADKIKGSLTLRAAKKGETITSLDHVKRSLMGGEIIIEDEVKIIDLAGLMGGLNSEVSDATQNVLLLVPIYDPVAIRRASKNLKLRTEASNRFEKKIDLSQCETVAKMAADLIVKEAGGIPQSRLEKMTPDYQAPWIKLSAEKIKKVLGLAIKADLTTLGIKVDGENYQPPTWRRDLETDVDLIEEMARLYGYNKLPKTLPSGTIPVHGEALKPNWIRKIRSLAANLGYTEAYSSTLINQSDNQHLKVLHPMSIDYQSLRTTILESLVPVSPGNWFELGTVFKLNAAANRLPIEYQELGLTSTTADFAQIKGQLETLADRLNLKLTIGPMVKTNPSYHPSNQAQIDLIGKTIGLIAQTKDKHAWMAAVNATALAKLANNQFAYPASSPYPAIIEDLTVTLPAQTLIGPVIEAIRETNRLVDKVSLTKTYGQNFTFRLIYNSPTRQLSAKDVQPVRRMIVANLTRRYKATLVGRL